MTTDTQLYDDAIEREAFGHCGLRLGRLGAAPGKNTMALINKMGDELAARGPIGAPAIRCLDCPGEKSTLCCKRRGI